MAVHIPVVIDIDQAFEEAAKKVTSAMQPLQKSIESLTEDLGVWRDLLNESTINSPDFIEAARNIQNISERLAEADYAMKRFSSNEKSIRQMTIDLADLEREWAEMADSQKYATSASGDKTLSTDAQTLIKNYKNVTAEIQKSGKTLAQIAAEERRIDQIKQKGVQTRRYENAILNTTIKTMRVLTEQERILSQRLSQATVGSNKFTALAAQLQKVKEEIRDARAQIDGAAASTNKLGASSKAARAGIDATTGALNNQSKVLVQLKTLAGMYISLFAGLRFVENIRKTTSELELQQVALGSILQDTSKANELFQQIKASALKSPFEIKDLITYTKQLAAYQIETDKLFDTTKKLADVSAGLGVDMNRLILAYGQVRAASVLRGQELRQFTEAGVPLVDKLAEKFSQLRGEMVSTGEVFELISKRAVPFSMIEEIFNDMTEAGGIFYNMQEKQSETLWGQWQKLKDALTIMYNEMGNTGWIHKGFENLIKDAMSLARSWRETSRWVGAVAASYATYSMVTKSAAVAAKALTFQEALLLAKEEERMVVLPRLVQKMVGETTAKRISTRATMRLTAAQASLKASTTVLEKAYWRLNVALLSNPYAAAAAGIVALGLGIWALVKNSQKAEVSVDSLEQSISNFNSQVKKTADMEKFISIYREYTEGVGPMSVEQQEKLARATKELANAYPSAISGVNAHTGALDINIEKVRELTRAEQDLAEARLKADEVDTEESIKSLRARRDKLMKKAEKGGYRADIWGGFHRYTETELREIGDQILEIEKKLEPLEATLKRIQEMEFVGPQRAEGVINTKMLATWKAELAEIQNKKVEAGATAVFSPDDIVKLGSVSELYDKIKKKIKEAEENLDGLKNIQEELNKKVREAKDDEVDAAKMAAASNEDDIKAAEKQLDLITAIKEAFGFIFKSSGGSKRDSRLQDLKNDISEVTNAYKKFQELKKYKSEDEALIEIDKLFPQLSGWKPTFDNLLKKLEGMRDDVRAKIAKNPKDKTLLDMQRALDTEISNLSFEKLKKEIDDKLKKLSDDIKRSETARNFFQNILDLTGDEQMAATMSVSVYGGIGEDFKQRMQRQLNEALKGLDASQMTDEIRKALETGDFKTIMNNLEKFPPEYQKLLGDVADAEQAFHAKQMEEWLKDVKRTKTYAEKRLEIVQKTAQRISEINESTLPQQQKDLLISQYNQKQAKDLAKLEYEAFKDSPIYIRMFEELDAVSTKALGNMRERLVALKSQWKDLDPTELKEMQRRLDELDEQLAVRNPFKAIAKGIREYRDLVKSSGTRSVVDATAIGADTNRKVQEDKLRQEEEAYALAKKEYDTAMALYGADSAQARKAKETLDTTRTRLFLQKQLVDRTKQEADAAEETSRKYDAAIKAIMDGVKGLQEWAGYVSDAGAGIHDIMDTFASEEATETFDTIMEGIQKTATGAGDLLVGTAKLMGGDIFGGISSIVKGLGGVIAGIFGTAKKLKIAELNRQIEIQARLLDDLAESYSNLEEALGKSFGSDYIYNYNQQLKNLVAQQKAAEEQLRLEKAKGNKASKDQIAEYEKAIREASKSISEMEGKLSEFFTGTDLTSASSQFANSWIEAYKTFSSTTAAMQEEFNSMVQNMVSNSIGAKLVQSILGPLFKQIDEMAVEGGEFSASEIAQIAQQAPQYIDQINNAMTTMMNQLGAAGYNMRRQAGGFTGISRNIANASEESINGLAAGINTQNFYISYVPLIYADVALIKEKLVGTTADVAGTGGGEEGPSYQDQMLMYVASLPVIRDDMAAIRAMLDRVIKPVGVKSSHYVSVNM